MMHGQKNIKLFLSYLDTANTLQFLFQLKIY